MVHLTNLKKAIEIYLKPDYTIDLRHDMMTDSIFFIVINKITKQHQLVNITTEFLIDHSITNKFDHILDMLIKSTDATNTWLLPLYQMNHKKHMEAILDTSFIPGKL